jgi:3-hydroxybutyryl-CoA dehydrogenase
MREALHLIDAGIASPEDVDDAVRYSFGFRYAAVGPITQKELSGWDVSCQCGEGDLPHPCAIPVVQCLNPSWIW